jgi:hypothetical protein
MLNIHLATSAKYLSYNNHAGTQWYYASFFFGDASHKEKGCLNGQAAFEWFVPTMRSWNENTLKENC